MGEGLRVGPSGINIAPASWFNHDAGVFVSEDLYFTRILKILRIIGFADYALML